MTDNILNFPKNKNEQAQQELQALQEVYALRYERKSIEIINKKISENKMIKKASDRIQIAQNLWSILQEFEERRNPIKKKDFLHHAGMGQPHESTKRLPLFALNPKLHENEKKRREKNLTKKISLYLKLIKSISVLGQKEESILVKRLVANTNYDVSHNNLIENDEQNSNALENIFDAVEYISNGITKRFSLIDFFNKVQDFGLKEDLIGKIISSTKAQNLYKSMPLDLTTRLWSKDEIPACPSIYLGVVRCFEDLECEITSTLGFGYGDMENELRDRLIEGGLDNLSIKGVASPVLQLWLDIRPYGYPLEIKPMLRISSMTYIIAAESFNDYVKYHGCGPFSKGDIIGKIRGPIKVGTIDFDAYEESGYTAAFDEETDSLIDIQFTAEFEPKTLETYLNSDHTLGGFEQVRFMGFGELALPILKKDVFQEPGVMREFNTHLTCSAFAAKWAKVKLDEIAPTTFPPTSMIAAIERCLFDVPDIVKIDFLLEKEATVVTTKIEDAIKEMKARRKNQLLRIFQKYKIDSDS